MACAFQSWPWERTATLLQWGRVVRGENNLGAHGVRGDLQRFDNYRCEGVFASEELRPRMGKIIAKIENFFSVFLVVGKVVRSKKRAKLTTL